MISIYIDNYFNGFKYGNPLKNYFDFNSAVKSKAIEESCRSYHIFLYMTILYP